MTVDKVGVERFSKKNSAFEDYPPSTAAETMAMTMFSTRRETVKSLNCTPAFDTNALMGLGSAVSSINEIAPLLDEPLTSKIKIPNIGLFVSPSHTKNLTPE